MGKKRQATPPPHYLKQRVVKDYARCFGIDVFIETGTFKGAMVNAVLNRFDQITSVELDEKLYSTATNRFSRFSHVQIIWGDSSQVLPKILSSLSKPCLFWLDAHYSCGNTARSNLLSPVAIEVRKILEHPIKEHVVLIDDARDFVGADGYPSIPELKKLVFREGFDKAFYVKDDIIRIHPHVELRRKKDSNL